MSGRGIGAFFAGLVASIVPTLATDWALHATGVFPPWDQRAGDGLLLLATVYRTVYGIGGSWLTAHLAPNRPMAHALALGGAGLIANVAGAVATWNAGPAYGPKWYPLALVALAVPTAWLGAKLFLLKRPGVTQWS